MQRNSTVLCGRPVAFTTTVDLLSLSLSLCALVKTHAWVNHESLLDRCLVGMLVPGEGDEEPAAGTSAEQEPTNGEEQELTSEQEAEVTMFPARGGQQVSK